MSKNDTDTDEVNGIDSQGAGGRLRAERKKQKLGMDTVAEALGLSANVIARLEENDYESLGAPVYARGYIRKYARFLGLPEDELMVEYKEYSTSSDPELQSPWTGELDSGYRQELDPPRRGSGDCYCDCRDSRSGLAPFSPGACNGKHSTVRDGSSLRKCRSGQYAGPRNGGQGGSSASCTNGRARDTCRSCFQSGFRPGRQTTYGERRNGGPVISFG